MPSLLHQVELCHLALDRIRQGPCVFDEEERLLLFSRQYAKMYDSDRGQLWIGMTLRDVVELSYSVGTGAGIDQDSLLEYCSSVCQAFIP